MDQELLELSLGTHNRSENGRNAWDTLYDTTCSSSERRTAINWNDDVNLDGRLCVCVCVCGMY
jgi:hypothetical protein